MFAALNLHFYSLSLIFSATFAFLLAAWIMRKRGHVFNWFGWMLIASACWAMAYGFELATSTLEEMLFWIKIEYLGISALPSLFLIFCYYFIGRTNRLVGFTFLILFGYSVINFLMVLTNDWHHLFYAHTSVDSSGPFPLLDIDPGPWYHIHTVVFYIMIALGYWALIDSMRQTRRVFRRQNRLLVIGTLIPLLVNFTYIFLDWRPYGHLDLTPFAFLATSFIIAVGLLRFGLFDISPMARSRVISELSDGVVVIDAFQRIIDYNESFAKLVATGNTDLIGTAIHDYFGEEYLPKDLLEDQTLKQNTHLVFRESKYLELSITGLFEKSGTINGAALLFKDVSARMRAQSELLSKTNELSQLNTLKDRLFSIIAHDLRGPLLNLQEVMQLVNANVLDEEERESMLQTLGQNVDQSVSMLQNLLSWAQSQQEGERLKLSSFKMADLANEVYSSLKPIFEKKSLQFQMNINEEAYVFADREMIQIVMRNLISNAIKFTEAGGQIEVACHANEEHCRISVSDNGIGMSPQVLEKLQHSEIVSELGTDQEEGTGLGLMLCRDFIQKNGGDLVIQSKEGEGSTFSFELPVAR